MAQFLTRVSRTAEASFYRVGGDFESAVERWVVSTPESRAICNRPELLGCGFTDALREAVRAALVQAPFRPWIERHPQTRVCVLNFLRGGLNFDLRGALHRAYGLNTHSSAFMSSQRRRVDGRWQVREDMYRKLEIPSNALLLIGDVVATGVTVENGLDVLLEHLQAIGSSLAGLVFFTIGCHKLEKSLTVFDRRCRQLFPDYGGSHAVYLEGKFRLVDSRSDLRIGIPGTDLIRRGALLAPELEASQLDVPSAVLERCAIYDAGSRAFDIAAYVSDVLGYWQQVAELATAGFTLADALAERWPVWDQTHRDRFFASQRRQWLGVDDDEILQLYERQRSRMADVRTGAGTAALAKMCEERVATLEATLEL